MSPFSAYENARSFSVPFPPEIDVTNQRLLALECSATRMVLGFNEYIYILSLPAFNLVHILEPKKHSRFRGIEVHGKLLVVTYSEETPDGTFPRGSFLYIWDLLAGRNLGTVVVLDGLSYKPTISAPETELVEIEENGMLIKQEWPDIPLLIISSKANSEFETHLNIYILECPDTEHTFGRLQRVEDSFVVLPVKIIRPTHWVYCIASMGRTAVTGGWDAIIRVWDIITGECRLVLIGHTIRVIDVTLDGSRIYSQSEDAAVRIWDRLTGDCLHVLKMHPLTHVLQPLLITPSYLITSGKTPSFNTISIWDHVSGRLVHQIDNEMHYFLGPAEGREHTVVTHGYNMERLSGNWFNIWDLTTGHIRTRILTGFIGPFTYPNQPIGKGRFFVIIAKQHGQYFLRIWDFGVDKPANEEVAWQNPRHFSIPLLPENGFTSNEDFVVVECSTTHLVLGLKTRICIYSLPFFDLVQTIGSENFSICRTLHMHGEILVVTYEDTSEDSFSEGCSLYVWDLTFKRHLGTVLVEDSWYKPIVSAPGTEIVEEKKYGFGVKREWPKEPVLLISSSEARLLRVYTLDRSVARGTGRSTPTEGRQGVTAAMHPVKTICPIHSVYSLASMGRTALTGGRDATVRVWDIVTGKCQLVLIGHTDTVSRVALDKARIYSLSFDHTVRLWDRHSGDCQEVLEVSARPSSYSTLQTAPSFFITTMSVIQQQYTVCIRDLLSGGIIHQIEHVKGCSFGPVRNEERTLVTRENRDETLIAFKIWDVKSGRVLCHTQNLMYLFALRNGSSWSYSSRGGSTRLKSGILVPMGRNPGERTKGPENCLTLTLTSRTVELRWKNPRRFSVFLPEDVRHIEPMRPALECSATHAVLAFDDHVYIYALSTFDLIHILNPGKLAIVGPIRIYGKILIITCNLHGCEQSTEYWSLYIWDLSTGRHIGNVQFYGQIVKYEISVTQIGAAEAMDNRKLVHQKWVEDPILITTSKPDRGNEAKLRSYILHYTGGASIEGPLEEDQEPPSRYMAPATAIPIRPASCVASLGRTAITGGWDATVHVHDFITGECQLVLMGHTNLVCDVSLDEKRIYSLSYDSTLRIWDRRSGDCQHVLENPVFENGGSHFLRLDTPYPHLITICAHPPSPTIRTWDPHSGKLIQKIHNKLGCDLGPKGEQEHSRYLGRGFFVLFSKTRFGGRFCGCGVSPGKEFLPTFYILLMVHPSIRWVFSA
ncbi:hypothetical protein CVT26_007680 [Gymnopilus dilepis]|uniref:Uncharacterized protein n=1 Tax=Gymnopilus dilepis TaxID=231916 RepID=A0A409WSB8_9AGAR|nr:hypothetical protein CVT26_007680 [Gymnopilus dilepis]